MCPDDDAGGFSPELRERLASCLARDADALAGLTRRIGAAETQAEDESDEGDGLTAAERQMVLQLGRIAKDGLAEVIGRLRSSARRTELQVRLEEYVRNGLQSVLRIRSARGNDFAVRQLQGQWAEDVVLSFHGDHVIRRLGPSGAAMPGEPDYETTVRTFRLIQLVEGKRPDLVAFEKAAWETLSENERRSAQEWPTRFLTDHDTELLARCSFGIEVKNSLWHYETRRRSDGGPLAVTMKEEERKAFQAWTNKTGRPIVFMQVFFDEIYCMSFKRMLEALERGHLYESGDVVTEKERKSGKDTHKFFLRGLQHRCGLVQPPDEKSGGRIKIAPNGQVAIYMVLEPARALDVNEGVIAREVAY